MTEPNGSYADALGMGVDFEAGGEVYRIAPLTTAMRAEFEQWLKRRAWATLDEVRAVRGALAAQQAEAQLFRDLAAQVYAWGGECWEQAFYSLPGQHYLFFLRLRVNRPKIAEAEAAALYDGLGGYERAFRLCAAADGPAPKAPAPAEPTGP